MKELQDRILKDGHVISPEFLKVDTFLIHQGDPELMSHIGEEFCNHFKSRGITKIATIESSGISPALMTALIMKVPLIILKKQPSQVLNDRLFQTEVTSFTTQKNYELCLASDVISSDDHVLLIDDFLADGEAMTGAVRLLRMAHATVAGVGIVIEKSFQPGSSKLVSQGLDVYSLAKIKEMDQNKIVFQN